MGNTTSYLDRDMEMDSERVGGKSYRQICMCTYIIRRLGSNHIYYSDLFETKGEGVAQGRETADLGRCDTEACIHLCDVQARRGGDEGVR